MLHPEAPQSYPNSQMYTPESLKIAPLALKPGARAPVLQYAHPELGVQPAKIIKNEKKRPDNFPDNQNSFTEQRHKKKYVLNDKNVVDSYTHKNYYPNQHFYGLKRPIDQPFWVKISENLRNQFSTGVERVSQLTRPVFDPLMEATQKISQNLGLTKGKEAQDKIGTVATGSSILIPALGLVASGAALGIGAVAVGRYLDVDVLKRSRDGADGEDELDSRRALGVIYPSTFDQQPDGNWKEETSPPLTESRSFEVSPNKFYQLREDTTMDSADGSDAATPKNEDGVFMVLEEVNDQERLENLQTKPAIDETRPVETSRRRRRSVDFLDVFKAEKMQDLVRNKRLRRTGADSLAEIVEIDVPTEGKIDITEYLLPTRNILKDTSDEIIVVNEDVQSNSVSENNVDPDEPASDDDLLQVETVAQETARLPEMPRTRSRRSPDSDQELDDALQNLENAEVAEAAHIAGDWTNTPCAKRIFCDAMIQRGQDASIFMEKKMEALLGL